MKRFSNTNAILAFVTVAREGSVSKAAEVLSLTQPAVSHQIKRLAEEWRCFSVHQLVYG